MSIARKHPANKLLQARKTFGYTQKEIRAIMSMKDVGRLSQWEKSRRLPSLKKAILLSILYKGLVDDLFYGLREDAVRQIEQAQRKLAAKRIEEQGTPP